MTLKKVFIEKDDVVTLVASNVTNFVVDHRVLCIITQSSDCIFYGPHMYDIAWTEDMLPTD